MSKNEKISKTVPDKAQRRALDESIAEFLRHDDARPCPVSKFGELTAEQLKAYGKDFRKNICVNVAREMAFPATKRWRERRLLQLVQELEELSIERAREELGMEELSPNALRRVVDNIPDLTIRDSHIVRTTIRKKQSRARHDKKKKQDIARSITLLLAGRVHNAPPALIPKLRALWQWAKKPERVLALDAGTTNDEVAGALANLSPRTSGISHLTVITNSPDVADVVSGRKSTRPTQHTVIQIGGKLRHSSEAYAGTLAEFSLDAMNIRPDISVIAATELNSMGEFGSSDQDESRVKARLLGPGGHLDHCLRVVDLDSSKILRMRGIAWLFASFADIDMLVTDDDVLDCSLAIERNEGGEEVDGADAETITRHFKTFWDLVDTYQRPVLVGDTFYLAPKKG